MNPPPGKTIGPRTYLHIDAASALDAVWTDRWRAAERITGLQRGAHYNLIRLDSVMACAPSAAPFRSITPRPRSRRLSRRRSTRSRFRSRRASSTSSGTRMPSSGFCWSATAAAGLRCAGPSRPTGNGARRPGPTGRWHGTRRNDFAGQPLPRLIERVKIKLREQDIDYFAYGEEYEPPFLYHKSRYVNEEFPHYPEQAAFEEMLEGLELFDLSGYGPPPAELRETLARHRWTINGFTLGRATSIPDLDDPCGAYLTFRQLIECGETQARTGLANRPLQPDSYTALLDLALNVLDPLIDYFGMIRLTYGFCSPALAREIPGRIDPKRDQHAAHERNRRGLPVCARLGAAVDFLIDDENMLEVAQWIVTDTPFDRLYFYGADQPLHASFGPNHDREIVCLMATPTGRRVPRVLARESFLAL